MLFFIHTNGVLLKVKHFFFKNSLSLFLCIMMEYFMRLDLKLAMESLKLNNIEELHVLLFLHFHGVLHKIYFFKGCEVLKTWFCSKELHKVNFWNSHGVLPTRFLLKNSIIPFFILQWSTPWGKLLRRLWGT